MAEVKIKMYCIFSKEAVDLMKGNRGKLAAQAGHAYLHAAWDSAARFRFQRGADTDWSRTYQRGIIDDYKKSERAYKICLSVPTEKELIELHEKYKKICGVALIKDAGFTVFEEPTITCLGIGPIYESDIGEDLKSLKVFI